MKTRLRILALSTLFVAWGTVCRSQDRPVAFVHGLGASGGTWEEAAARLQGDLQLAAFRPDLSWRLPYGTQASELQHQLGWLPGSTVAIGHSNGGVIARQWNRGHALSGLVTLGTPNRGAPLAGNILHWVGFNFDAGDAISALFDVVAQCYWAGCGWDWVIYYQGLNSLLSNISNWLGGSLFSILSTAGVEIGAPVLGQMAPGSAFLNDVNSPGNIAREIAEVPVRIGIASVAHNFYNAGPFRAAWPNDADAIDSLKDFSIVALDAMAFSIYFSADPSDYWAWWIAGALSNAAGYLYAIDPFWCSVVSSYPNGPCDYNDTIVPLWSQYLPDAPETAYTIHMFNGPTHIQETTQSDAVLHMALTTLLNVPPRQPPPPPAGYVGCFTDDANRALPAWFGEGHSIESCVNVARQNGYAYAGLQWYGHCFAGNTIGYSHVGDNECNTPCSANPGQMCGGGWRNSIYAAGPPPPRPLAYRGCYTDDENRALPAWFGEGHTIESCVNVARQNGYSYAGLQWYGHCFAGNSIGYSQVGDNECNTPCSANPGQMCGGGWRNSIYAAVP